MKPVHTHYDNLKVARNAPPEVIRAAYKTLCHQFHPDHHAGSAVATQTFQLISTAYRVLSDPDARRVHDQWIARIESENESRQHQSAERQHQIRRQADRRRTDTQTRPGAGFASLRVQWRNPSRSTVFWLSLLLVGAMLGLLFQA